MNQHDQDILELGLRAKNVIWAENHGLHRSSATLLAIWRRVQRIKYLTLIGAVAPRDAAHWAGPGFNRRNDESSDG